MTNSRHENRRDGLKELESMLEQDLLRNQPAMKGLGVTREQLRRALVRLGISTLLLLVVFWLGIFENPSTVMLGVALVAVLEVLLLFVGPARDKENGPSE